jgi:trans-L-3-hydroxyproline dehydratase
VLFMHNEGFSTMCGHGIIGLATVLVEARMVAVSEPVTEIGIDTPAGLVPAQARVDAGRVVSVAFRNVPSFVVGLDRRVEVPGLGEVAYDLAFGGAFYAYVRAADVGLACTTAGLDGLVKAAAAIKAAVSLTGGATHPFEPELSFVYGVVFTGPGAHPGTHTRNVCVFADGEVDRSPTGTSVSAQLALLRARGAARLGEPFVFESILGTTFRGRIAGEAPFGPYAAVVPEVEGRAHITGRHEFMIDPADPLGRGFLLR